MQTDPYAPPTSQLEDKNTEVAFFAVSITKLSTMYLVTMGSYIIVWFYYNWAMLKTRLVQKYGSVWPVPRAIFCIFFTHSLFRIIHARAEEKQVNVSWNSGSQATFFVVLTILGNVMSNASDQVSDNVQGLMLAILGIVIVLVTLIPILAVQRTVNTLNDDPTGAKNARFSAANILWLLFFGLVWAFMLFGIALLAGLIDLPEV